MVDCEVKLASLLKLPERCLLIPWSDDDSEHRDDKADGVRKRDCGVYCDALSATRFMMLGARVREGILKSNPYLSDH